MVDMRKEFPAKSKNRDKWCYETIREHQLAYWLFLGSVLDENSADARTALRGLQRMDRDAFMLTLTDEQRAIFDGGA